MVMVRDEPTMQHCNSALTVHGHHEELGRDAQPGNGNIGQLNNNETRAAHAGAARVTAPDCPLIARLAGTGIRGMRAFFII